MHCLIIRYLNHLHSTLKPTSQKHVILDAESFLKFLRAANLPRVRMTVRSISCILEKLAAWKKGLGPEVVLQRLAYKNQKAGALHGKEVPVTPSLELLYHCHSFLSCLSKETLVSGHDLVQLVAKAEKEVVEAMRELAGDLQSLARKASVVGLLVGLLVVVTGHCKCVFTGMTVKEVMDAEPVKKKKKFAIRVSFMM